MPGQGIVGVARGWPPTYRGLPLAWKNRKPVHGFRLSPGRGFNMTLGVEATGVPRAGTGNSRAGTPGMTIHYRTAAGCFVLRDHFAMRIAVNMSQC